MYVQEHPVNANIVMPVERYDMDSAAADPLSSPALLSRLFHDYESQDKTEPYPLHFSALARNPSLSPQIFAALLVKLQEYEDSFDVNLAYMDDVRSYFFLNPLTTFEQVLSIVISSKTLRTVVEDVNFEGCRTVVEIFDKLVPLVEVRSNYFLSRLLCSPLVSVEDFRIRLATESIQRRLDNWIVFSSSHFIPTSDDYSRALNDLSSMKSSDFERGLGVVHNENATPEFLREALEHAGGQDSVVGWAYENLNCPIELSARFHSENIEDYRWRPSFLHPFEHKVDKRLALTVGSGPWEDLPLSWKLRMIAE